MAAVMIGVDPHKASHTAAAIGPAEEPLGQVRVRASACQAEQLVAWAAAWPERTWAVEGATGLGSLLARQLVAAGERVLDVQPKLAARVRLLEAGNTNKNDPNDARSVAVAALRSATRREVAAEGHAAVLKVWSKRYRDLGRARTQLACRLHALLCDLVPGGFGGEITAGQATGLLARITPADPAARARCELAAEFLADLRRLDSQLLDTRAKLAAAVRASGTTLTEIFGVGPVIAAAIIAAAGDAGRFADRNRFAAYNGTAPVEVSSGGRKIHRLSLRGNRRLNHAIHMAAVTQIRYKHSPGRGYFDRKIAEGKTGKEALRALKRQLSDAIYTRLQADAARPGAPAEAESPGGQPGNGSVSSAADSHPDVGSSEKPLPDRNPAYDQPTRPGEQRQRSRRRTRAQRLDNKEVFVLHAGRVYWDARQRRAETVIRRARGRLLSAGRWVLVPGSACPRRRGTVTGAAL